MRKYTKEEANTIVKGLASGRRPGHRPMSEAEFRRIHEPERSEQQELMRKLDALIDVVKDMTTPPEPERGQSYTRPYNQPPPLPKASGTVEL